MGKTQYLEAAGGAQRIAGVTDVHNHLEVVLPDGGYRDDAMLTTAANNALALNEHDAVVGAAWMANGVLDVRDDLAIVWPGPTALVLVLVVGIWAFAGGIMEVAAAFGSGETAGTRALFVLSGLVSAAFGVVLFARPGVGAVTLALLFGLFSLIYGGSQIISGVQLRRAGKTLHTVLPDAA
jgi:hypothetical protein